MIIGALFFACGAGGAPEIPTQDVVSTIPWTVPETARYRLLDDDEVVGSAVLSIEQEGENLKLSQEFEDKDREFQDRVTAVVDGKTLKPQVVERVISGPEGERRCHADYAGDSVKIRQEAGEERRTDRLELAFHSYDSWTDLFLWRSIEFRRGYAVSYRDVGTCILARPEQATTKLEVITQEHVIVPAGSFDAWRLEVRTGGRSQRAWITDTPGRTLVKYDNGRQVFELESLE